MEETQFELHWQGENWRQKWIDMLATNVQAAMNYAAEGLDALGVIAGTLQTNLVKVPMSYPDLGLASGDVITLYLNRGMIRSSRHMLVLGNMAAAGVHEALHVVRNRRNYYQSILEAIADEGIATYGHILFSKQFAHNHRLVVSDDWPVEGINQNRFSNDDTRLVVLSFFERLRVLQEDPTNVELWQSQYDYWMDDGRAYLIGYAAVNETIKAGACFAETLHTPAGVIIDTLQESTYGAS